MTALGFLYPGHSAEDDYPRIEQLLGSDIRLALIHSDIGADVEELRLSGAEAVVWVCASEGFTLGRDAAYEQVRGLAKAAGLPASSTPFAFAHAVRELGATRVAVAAPHPDEVAAPFAAFLRPDGIEVVAARGGGAAAEVEAGAWGYEEVLALARGADRPEAEVLLLPDPALHTAAHVRALESALAKPVLTASQVTVWEALRLADRRVNAPALGTLFTREPLIQAPT